MRTFDEVFGETFDQWRKRMLDESLADISKAREEERSRKGDRWTEDDEDFFHRMENIIWRNFSYEIAKKSEEEA